MIEIDCKFDIVHKELLTGYTFKEAKLYLQKNYLDNKCDDILNVTNYCFCKNETTERLPIELKEKIIADSLNGMKRRDISIKYDIDPLRITTLLKTNGVNKKSLFENALIDYNNDMKLIDIVKKYRLSNYMIEKLINTL